MLPPVAKSDLDHVLQHTEGLWKELRGRRLFITGGTGFFGTWLLETFAHANETLQLGATALALSRDPHAFGKKAPHLYSRADIQFYQGDVRTFSFPQGEFSHCIHAGTTSSAPVAPQEMFSTIVDGTRRVIDFAAASGVRKLLFVSSGAVYGRQPPGLSHVAEDYAGSPNPLDANSAYGEGKRAAELLCAIGAASHGFELKVARCFAFVGPHLPLDSHFAIGNFIRDALSGGPIRIAGDGTPCRSYLYAADLMIWLWTILFRGAAGRAYNVGSREPVSILETAQAVKVALDMKGDILVARQAEPSSERQRYVPCVARACDELRLRETLVLAEAIRRSANWAREMFFAK